MIDNAIRRAVKAVCKVDGMNEDYERALATLIENTMMDNLDTSDIYDLLDKIEVEEPADED
ncbi:hypothetical protein [Rhizobium sp. L1K21]|uniref:hypothetical protein n=1 Tax=Rhizobium sp. L1K21 TaxID=2954933 RepID=UPI002092A238|nr:hypothetical protein [Rhizobium sp. L1K21]MCO6185215.1 hypothetical protein [Rhizobium sp. L1K21]